jgi:ABC-type dipeptide/oligopeptide/nickel transport system ATPase component
MLLASAVVDEPAIEAIDSAPGVAVNGGCVFAARCPHRLGPICDTISPPPRTLSESHSVACHLDAVPVVALRPASPHPVAQHAIGAR